MSRIANIYNYKIFKSKCKFIRNSSEERTTRKKRRRKRKNSGHIEAMLSTIHNLCKILNSLSKLCSDKRTKYKKPQEFPDEPAHDPMDDEALAYVQKMMNGRVVDGTITENVGKESYYGNTEYKLTLMDKEKERQKHLTTQLNFRLNEGKGQAVYRIGVEDNGNPLGINDDHLIGSLSIRYSLNKDREDIQNDQSFER